MTLTLRRDKGSALTYDELDDNFEHIQGAATKFSLEALLFGNDAQDRMVDGGTFLSYSGGLRIGGNVAISDDLSVTGTALFGSSGAADQVIRIQSDTGQASGIEFWTVGGAQHGYIYDAPSVRYAGWGEVTYGDMLNLNFSAGELVVTGEIIANGAVEHVLSIDGAQRLLANSSGVSIGGSLAVANSSTAASAAAVLIEAGASGTSSLAFGDTAGIPGGIVYDHATNTMTFSANGVAEAILTSTTLRPVTDNGLDLGSTSYRWDNLYLSTGILISNTASTGAAAGIGIVSGAAGLSAISFGDSDNATMGVITYSNIADQFTFEVANAIEAVLTSGSWRPSGDAGLDLGTNVQRFKDLYLSGGAFIGGTAAANKLDDYEEGTFTPGLTFGGASTGITYLARAGRYTKVGDLVTITGYVALNSNGTASGLARITDLPFTSSNDDANMPWLGIALLTGAGLASTELAVRSIIDANSTVIKLQYQTTTGTGNVNEVDLPDSAIVGFTVQYHAA